jgi:hypothetical protein
MAVYINQNVFRLDISIDYVQIMEMLKAKQQLSEVELSFVFSKFLDLAEMKEHLTSSAQIHDKKQFGLGLKRPVEFDDERMV